MACIIFQSHLLSYKITICHNTTPYNIPPIFYQLKLLLLKLIINNIYIIIIIIKIIIIKIINQNL